MSNDTFSSRSSRPHTDGLFSREEVQLANRNSGLLLEALRHDVTPVGLHYLLNHFDVPYVASMDWQIAVGGKVARPRVLTLPDILRLPQQTLRVTLECAGNGRANISPRYQSMPWMLEAVGTAEWTGTPLRLVLEEAGLADDAIEVVFTGADRGFDRGSEHAFARSLTRDIALSGDALLVHAMNGLPLAPQHGYPLRLVVPGWYGMASVKWLTRIDAVSEPFRGHQQVGTYVYRERPGGPGVPVTHLRVRSLMAPPGIPDFYSRRRMVDAGRIPLMGRAWSGDGVPVTRVQVGIDGVWHDADLDPPAGRYAWRGWTFGWDARPGTYEIACRAEDANGQVQPLDARWDNGGFGNNAVQRVSVTVRPPSSAQGA